MNLCDYDTIRDLLGRHGFHFSKSMGQNFLIDPQVPADIADASQADLGCGVLEIGPGIGPLTAQLAPGGARRWCLWSWTAPSCPFWRRPCQTMTTWRLSRGTS